MNDENSGVPIPPEHINYAPKWLLNGFPKAGLHCAWSMMRSLAHPMPPGQMRAWPWLGTFNGRSWTLEWVNYRKQMFYLAQLQPGHVFLGHMAWTQDIAAFMWLMGCAHVFIYRDLRDVAVSQAYHVIDPDDTRFAHEDKDLYRNLGGFDEVLEAVLVGIDRYPGLLERWAHWAPWLDVDWTYKFRFERAIAEPRTVATELVEYGLHYVADIIGGPELRARGPSFDTMVDSMVRTMSETDKSATFRKGKAGSWREHFTERHKALFKERDKDNWLVRLGYEPDDNW